MALFSTIPMPQPEPSFRFISYKGPPIQKQTLRRIPSKKVPSGNDECPDIDEILGLKTGSNTEEGIREELTHTAHGVEVVDLSSVDNEATYEISCSGGESGDVSSDDPIDEQEGVSMPNSQEDTEGKASRRSALSEGSSQGNAIVIDDSQSDSEADEADPCDEDPGSHMDDPLELPCISTPEYHDREIPTGTVDKTSSEAVDGSNTQTIELPQWQLPSTPPTSPSITSIEQSMEEVATHQRPTNNKVEPEVALPTIGSTNSGSSSESDTDNDDHIGKHPMMLTRKRKRPTSANNASRKRQSQGLSTTLRPSTMRTVSSTRRQKPPPSQKKAVPGRGPDVMLASVAQSSVCDTEMSCDEDSGVESSEGSIDQDRHFRKGRKLMETNRGSVWCSRSNASTYAPLHATRTTRLSVKDVPPRQIQWRLSDIAFHSLSADVSFLTAIFRACSGPGILSTSHAVILLKSTVGDSTSLEDITIKPLTSDKWFLTGLVDHSDGARRGTGQLVPALPSLQAKIACPLDDSRPDDDVDDTLSIDYEKSGDEGEEYLSDVVDKPLSSRKNCRWSTEDDDHLRQWKEEDNSWTWICSQFSDRSSGAVKTRWYTKLRCEPSRRTV